MKGDERNLKVSFDPKNSMTSCTDELNNTSILMIYRKTVASTTSTSFCLLPAYITTIIR